MFRSLNNDKIGNVLVFFAEKIPSLPMTKALKLLFLLDKSSLQETGEPVTWLDYKAWKMGPVAETIYKEIRHGQLEEDTLGKYSLEGYIDVHKYEEGDDITIVLHPSHAFNEEIFCEYEIDLLNRIVNDYGRRTGADLIEFTHEAGGPWQQTVAYHNLKAHFRKGINTSPFTIDMVKDLSEENQSIYLASLEAMQTKRAIKTRGNRN